MRLPRDRPARRRIVALLATAGVAGATGLAVGARDDDGRARTAPAPDTAPAGVTPAVASTLDGSVNATRLSLRRRAGLLVVMRFKGTRAPAYVERALRAGRAPGVILFRDNIASPAALRRLTRRLHAAAGGKALVATDQEGGAVRNLPWAPPSASQGATASAAAAGAAARGAAKGLRDAGINVNLAPVADVASVPGSVMSGRAFPGDAAVVADLVAASVRAYRGSGVAPVAKHFPGLGGALANTDDVAVRLPRSPAQLVAEDLPPFRAAVAAGVPVVMASHAVYPAIDGDAVASQSPQVLDGVLRRRLGFRGVIVTDSIEAAAVSDRMLPETAAIASLRAGADLVLTTGPGSHLRSLRAIIREAHRSPAFARRVTAAAARVLALRRTLAGPPPA